MSLLDRIRGKKPAHPAAATPSPDPSAVAPAPPALATSDQLVALALSARMPEADAKAWAGECVEAKLTYADAAVKLAGALAAENAETAAAAAETAARATAATETAKKAAEQALAAEQAAKAAQASADAETAKLRDTNIKLGDAGKGLDPKDAPAVVVTRTAPAAAVRTHAAGSVKGVTAAAPLGMGGEHPYEKRVAELVGGAAGEKMTLRDACTQAAGEDRERHLSFIDFQEDKARGNGRRAGR